VLPVGLTVVLVTLGVIALPATTADGQRWTAAGLTIALLGAASLTVGGGSDVPAELARQVASGVTPRIVGEVGVALALLGLVAIGIGGRSVLPAIAVAMAVAFVVPLARAVGPGRSVGVAALAAGTLLLLWALTGLTGPGRLLRWLDEVMLDRAAHTHRRRSTLRRVVLIVALAPLIPVVMLSLQVLGALPAWYGALSGGPYSDAAAILLVLLLLAPVIALAGVWPLHGVAPGPWLSLAALGLLRFAAVALPAGVTHWQRLGIPLAVVGLAHGLARRRADLVLASGGLVGAWSTSVEGWIGSGLLFGSATVAALARRWPALVPHLPGALASAAWVVPLVGGALTLRAGLATEVVYTVLLTGLVAIGVAPRFRMLPRGVASLQS
jgi:hypothetical protein